MTDVVIIGGGPGGYEAALVGAHLGGKVTVIERAGVGGSAVLTDVVPSKGLIAVSDVMTRIRKSNKLGLEPVDPSQTSLVETVRVDAVKMNERLLELAAQQSADIQTRLNLEGVRTIHGNGRLDGTEHVIATTPDGKEERLHADIILVATGTRPRELDDAKPDGERILNWKQLYNLREMPRKLIVVGSGVTGAEFASAYHALRCEVVLVSSREMVLPSQDADAARVIQEVFERRGMEILSRSRAVAARRTEDGVIVTLADGRVDEIEIGFENGVPVSLDGRALAPVALIEQLETAAKGYAIGRGIHLGDTILGTKGRVAFEAPAAAVFEREQLELRDFKARILRRVYLTKGERPVAFAPEALTAEPPVRDDQDGEGWQMTVAFTLGAGRYATLVMKAAAALIGTEIWTR